MADTTIEWTDKVWNPLLGCSRVSAGCERCYAERFSARFGHVKGHAFEGLSRFTPSGPRWTGEVRLVEDKLDQPLRWKRPRRIFVNSMSDLFHENVSDEWIDRIFAAMALAPQHTFQVLTKRPERMLAYFKSNPYERILSASNEFDGKRDRLTREHGISDPSRIPWKWVWFGVSVENQATADERIPLLLQTPAAVWWVSAEPLLGLINLQPRWVRQEFFMMNPPKLGLPHLNWVVVGGESGPGARPFDLAWARSIVGQCRAAGMPVFVKQLGARQMQDGVPRSEAHRIKSKKGGDPSEWPEDLRVREFPAAITEGKA